MSLKFKLAWIILLLLFFYTNKRYDIYDNFEAPYNFAETVDLILG